MTSDLRHCLRCDRGYSPTWRPQRYCSRNCAADARLVERVRQCACGGTFTAKRAHQRHCSLACASRWGRPLHMHSCANCGAQFETRTAIRRFCSRRCGLKSRPARRIRSCEQCDQPYASVDSRQRFCSPECGYLSKRALIGPLCPNWRAAGQGITATSVFEFADILAVRRMWATSSSISSPWSPSSAAI